MRISKTVFLLQKSHSDKKQFPLKGIKDIFETLKKIKAEGTTILIVEQNALATLKIADYAYVLELGKISMHGKSSDLLKDKRLVEAYLGGK